MNKRKKLDYIGFLIALMFILGLGVFYVLMQKHIIAREMIDVFATTMLGFYSIYFGVKNSINQRKNVGLFLIFFGCILLLWNCFYFFVLR